MAIDLIIRNGTIIDGSGRPGFVGDLAISGDTISEIGRVDAGAATQIDASGKIVAPGFVDPHTHYDAQLSWDQQVTPSSWHGVTTAVIGNCGVGIAPCRPDDRPLAITDLVNVEAIPENVLQAGIDWRWESFPEFMQATVSAGVAINIGFMVPLSPLRTFVLGTAASDRAATASETDTIAGLLAESVEAGALGFSSSQQPNHIGHHGKPLASRLTSDDEFRRYAQVLKTSRRGAVEIAVTKQLAHLADDEFDLLEMLLDQSGRHVSWLTLLDLNGAPSAAWNSLDKAAPLAQRGCYAQTVIRPFLADADLHNPFMFATLPGWGPVFNQSTEKQMEIFAQAGFRRQFKEEMAGPGNAVNDWNLFEVQKVNNPELVHLVGQTVQQIADEQGIDGCDALLDLAIADDVQSRFTVAVANSDDQRLKNLICDERVRIGLADGGAHVDMLGEAGYPTYLLGYWVRERGVMSLERAVQRITSEPAELFGISDRGRLQEGLKADVVVFDADQVGSDRRPHLVDDLPEGGVRMVTEARGIEHVIVNGVPILSAGSITGSLPGRIA
ncbi:MAG TPA: amidohydrolase [Gammaproteobacteria bacterium]|nr:amidohydrolase [Gammaproteobacteria bacterium]